MEATQGSDDDTSQITSSASYQIEQSPFDHQGGALPRDIPDVNGGLLKDATTLILRLFEEISPAAIEHRAAASVLAVLAHEQRFRLWTTGNKDLDLSLARAPSVRAQVLLKLVALVWLLSKGIHLFRPENRQLLYEDAHRVFEQASRIAGLDPDQSAPGSPVKLIEFLDATHNTIRSRIEELYELSPTIADRAVMETYVTADDVLLFKSIASIRQLFVDVVTPTMVVQKVLPELVDLVPKILIQQVVFDNGCKFLLLNVAESRQDVENMFEDPKHSIWSNTIAHQHLRRSTAHFYRLCLKSLERIRRSLCEMHNELHTTKMEMSRRGHMQYPDETRRPTSDRTEEILVVFQGLRKYNDLFSTLILRAIPRKSIHVKRSPFGEEFGCTYVVGATPASYNHVRCIERASQVLYETLSGVWTCHDHERHSLSISLNFDDVEAGAIVQTHKFRFDIAVTSPFSHGPYRIVVDSAHGEFCTCQTVGDDRSLKKTFLQNNLAEPDGLGFLQTKVPNLGLEEDLCL